MYKRHFEKLGIKIKPDPGEPNQCGSGSEKLLCRSHFFAAVLLLIWLMCAYVLVVVRVQIII
jgi:hypothetical protein